MIRWILYVLACATWLNRSWKSSTFKLHVNWKIRHKWKATWITTSVFLHIKFSFSLKVTKISKCPEIGVTIVCADTDVRAYVPTNPCVSTNLRIRSVHKQDIENKHYYSPHTRSCMQHNAVMRDLHFCNSK